MTRTRVIDCYSNRVTIVLSVTRIESETPKIVTRVESLTRVTLSRDFILKAAMKARHWQNLVKLMQKCCQPQIRVSVPLENADTLAMKFLCQTLVERNRLDEGFPIFLRFHTTWAPSIANAYHFFQNN